MDPNYSSGMPAHQDYWKPRLDKEPRVSEVISPGGYTSKKMDEYRSKSCVPVVLCDASKASVGLPVSFVPVFDPKVAEAAKNLPESAGGDQSMPARCPKHSEQFLRDATGQVALGGTSMSSPSKVVQQREQQSRGGEDPAFEAPPGYPWSHKQQPPWKHKAPYASTHRTRATREIAQLQAGQNNGLKEVREHNGAPSNPYDSGVGPMQVGYESAVKPPRASPSPKTPVLTRKNHPSSGLPSSLKTAVENKSPSPKQDDVTNLLRENTELRRRLAARVGYQGCPALQSQEIKTKQTLGTPFGRSRRRVDDISKGQLEGQMGLGKEVRQWAGATENAYNGEPGGLSKGYVSPPKPSPGKASGDRYGPKLSLQYSSQSLPLTFQPVEGRPPSNLPQRP